jgi:hypothetical protein
MVHKQKKFMPIKLYVLPRLKKGEVTAYATNYIVASKKMGVTPYELRTYGHIEKDLITELTNQKKR